MHEPLTRTGMYLAIWMLSLTFSAKAVAMPEGCLAGSQGVFVSTDRLAELRIQVTQRQEPAYSAFMNVAREARAGLRHQAQAPST